MLGLGVMKLAGLSLTLVLAQSTAARKRAVIDRVDGAGDQVFRAGLVGADIDVGAGVDPPAGPRAARRVRRWWERRHDGVAAGRRWPRCSCGLAGTPKSAIVCSGPPLFASGPSCAWRRR